jgi:hypothetical protein
MEGRFLVASKKPGLGQHAFDHGPHIVPIFANTCTDEIVASAGAGAMRGDNVGDDRRQVEYDGHDTLAQAVSDTWERTAFEMRSQCVAPAHCRAS